MKQLKTLIEEGDNNKIISYIKGDFSKKINTYINSLEQVPTLQNQVLEMQIKGLERQKKLDEIIAKL